MIFHPPNPAEPEPPIRLFSAFWQTHSIKPSLYHTQPPSHQYPAGILFQSLFKSLNTDLAIGYSSKRKKSLIRTAQDVQLIVLQPTGIDAGNDCVKK
jgi:hypothetical protein